MGSEKPKFIKLMSEDKITKAKIHLLTKHPFFASLALGIDYIENNEIKTACTDGECIEYNANFINSLNLLETAGLVAHEIAHIFLFHHLRREGRRMERWNRAADYAINLMLEDSGLTLPANVLLDRQYENQSAEQIYNTLQDEPEKEGVGDVKDGKAKSESEKTEAISKIKRAVGQAAKFAKQAGQFTSSLSRFVEEILQPQINWKEVLAAFLTEKIKSDYSFNKPNLRFLHTGFFLPSLESVDEIGEIVFVIDTSASISNKIINMVASEMQEIVNTFNKSFLIIFCDTKVQSTQTIEPDETIKLDVQGFGGTSFVAPFKYLEENDINPLCLVYLTDLECYDFPQNAPDYEVLWMQYGNYRNDRVPFGDVIKIDEMF